MAEYRSGDRVAVDVSAGIVPGASPEPDWQPCTVVERLDNDRYRVRLDAPIAGRTAEKEAAAEHLRPL
jgi:hypothetical protein